MTLVKKLTKDVIKYGVKVASRSISPTLAEGASWLTYGVKNGMATRKNASKVYNLANDSVTKLFSNELDDFELINHSHATEAKWEYREQVFEPVHKFFIDIIEREKEKEMFVEVDVDNSIKTPILTVQEDMAGAFEKRGSLVEELAEAVNVKDFRIQEEVQAKIEVPAVKGWFW